MAEFGSERLTEAAGLLGAGRADEAAALLADYRSQISELTSLACRMADTGRVHELQQAPRTRQAALARFLEKTDVEGQQAADQAIEPARRCRAVLERLMQGGSPSELAPGQQRRAIQGPATTEAIAAARVRRLPAPDAGRIQGDLAGPLIPPQRSRSRRQPHMRTTASCVFDGRGVEVRPRLQFGTRVAAPAGAAAAAGGTGGALPVPGHSLRTTARRKAGWPGNPDHGQATLHLKGFGAGVLRSAAGSGS